jgi:hypothetical protein
MTPEGRILDLPARRKSGPADKHHGSCRTVGRRLVGACVAIDDETAIKVVDGTVEVVSEGHWKLFTRSAVATESGY